MAIDTVIENLHEQSSANPSEVLYFQTSKGIYETGEDLWFKAYQLDAQSFGLSDKSKTLYLQMINSCDSIVWQEKYPIESGVVSGHIYIDEKLSNGDYFLFGYTKGSFYAKDTIGIIPSRKVKIVKNITHAQVPEPPRIVYAVLRYIRKEVIWWPAFLQYSLLKLLTEMVFQSMLMELCFRMASL